MLKRRQSTALFAVPALLVLTDRAAMVLAATGRPLSCGFGDNPWPPFANPLLGAFLLPAVWRVGLGLLFVPKTLASRRNSSLSNLLT